jgi:hypothetical protein
MPLSYASRVKLRGLSLSVVLAISGSFSATFACGRVADEVGNDDGGGDVAREGGNAVGTDGTLYSAGDVVPADVSMDAPIVPEPSDADGADACFSGAPCAPGSSGCSVGAGDTSYVCLCNDVRPLAQPTLQCFDCYEGGPCGGGTTNCRASLTDASYVVCACVDGSYDCVDVDAGE